MMVRCCKQRVGLLCTRWKGIGCWKVENKYNKIQGPFTSVHVLGVQWSAACQSVHSEVKEKLLCLPSLTSYMGVQRPVLVFGGNKFFLWVCYSCPLLNVSKAASFEYRTQEKTLLKNQMLYTVAQVRKS